MGLCRKIEASAIFAVVFVMALVMAAGGARAGEPNAAPPAAVTSVAYGPDGTVLASDSSGALTLWDVAAAKPRWKDEDLPAGFVAFSPDGQWVASAYGSVKLWRADTGAAVRTLPTAGPIAFSPDGTFLATGLGNQIVVVETASGTEVRRFPATALLCLAWSPTSAQLAAAGDRTGLHLYDPTTGHDLGPAVPASLPTTPTAPKRTGDDGCFLAYSSDGKRLAAQNPDGHVDLIDAATRSIVSSSTVGTAGPLAWSADGQRLATEGDEGGIVVLDGKLAVVATIPLWESGLEGVPILSSLALDAHGQHVAAGTDFGVQIFTVPSGALTALLPDSRTFETWRIGGQTLRLTLEPRYGAIELPVSCTGAKATCGASTALDRAAALPPIDGYDVLGIDTSRQRAVCDAVHGVIQPGDRLDESGPPGTLFCTFGDGSVVGAAELAAFYEVEHDGIEPARE
jgi:hypothetical protein